MFEPGRDAPADADPDMAGRELGEPARGFHLGRVTDANRAAMAGITPNGFETISNPLPDTALRLVRLHLNSFRPVASVGQPQIDVVGEFLGMQVKKRESLSPDQLPRRRAAFPLVCARFRQ
jgi:hypothetical protein